MTEPDPLTFLEPDTVEVPSPIGPPEFADEFERQVRACARKFEPFCDELARRYHPRVIQAALLMAGADAMAQHIECSFLKPRLARRFLYAAWRHTFAQSGWWDRVPGRRAVCVALCIVVGTALGMITTGCAAQPIHPEPAVDPIAVQAQSGRAEYAEIADWVQDRIANDATYIRYLMWAEDFCKLPSAERTAIAQQMNRSEPNCAALVAPRKAMQR